MVEFRSSVVREQAGSGAAAPRAPEAVRAPTAPSREELREQIRNSIIDAQQAAREAARVRVDQHGNIVPAIAHDQGEAMIHVGPGPSDIPPQVETISIAFFVMCAVMVIGWPIARAFGKRLERRTEAAAIDPAMSGQLQRIEQAVEAMAIEIERISESQRFMAKLQNSAVPGGALPSAERR
jgi:hypothetical protein